jgi:hypothetical protein
VTSSIFEVDSSGELRQGDVCSVGDFPQWTVKSSPVHQQAGQKKIGLLVESWSQPLALPDGNRLVVVCSYDCDLDNPRARAGVLLAPLMPLPAPPGSEKAQSIIASNVPTGDKIAHVSMFYIPIEIGSNERLAVADFSSMMTLCPAKDAVDMLLANKYREITETVREQFQDKLALFTTRRKFSDDEDPQGDRP